MNYTKQVWDQLRNLTADRLIKALEKDGWIRDIRTSNFHVYRHADGRRVISHYHTQKTYGQKLLKGLLDDIGWSAEDLKRLKLIK